MSGKDKGMTSWLCYVNIHIICRGKHCQCECHDESRKTRNGIAYPDPWHKTKNIK
jgi:hypothetical protein